MKKFKKLIAVALAVILSLSVMSVAAFASTTDSLKRTADGTWLYMENGEHNAYYTVPLYGLPMFPSCRNTISVLNTQCI